MIPHDRIKARADLIATLADEFEQSGIEYTCGAVVMAFARTRIIPLTWHMPREWVVHSSFKIRRIERDTWSEVQRRTNARRRGK